METGSRLPNWLAYVLLPAIVFLFIYCSKDGFFLTGIIQLLVGAVQLLIALFKTIVQKAKYNRVSKGIRLYWLFTFLYFAIAPLATILLELCKATEGTSTLVISAYIALAWAIALFHFRHVQFAAGEETKERETV